MYSDIDKTTEVIAETNFDQKEKIRRRRWKKLKRQFKRQQRRNYTKINKIISRIFPEGKLTTSTQGLVVCRESGRRENTCCDKTAKHLSFNVETELFTVEVKQIELTMKTVECSAKFHTTCEILRALQCFQTCPR